MASPQTSQVFIGGAELRLLDVVQLWPLGLDAMS
jgi:hypothetical protein